MQALNKSAAQPAGGLAPHHTLARPLTLVLRVGRQPGVDEAGAPQGVRSARDVMRGQGGCANRGTPSRPSLRCRRWRWSWRLGREQCRRGGGRCLQPFHS
jgi:hypothetical protein